METNVGGIVVSLRADPGNSAAVTKGFKNDVREAVDGATAASKQYRDTTKKTSRDVIVATQDMRRAWATHAAAAITANHAAAAAVGEASLAAQGHAAVVALTSGDIIKRQHDAGQAATRYAMTHTTASSDVVRQQQMMAIGAAQQADIVSKSHQHIQQAVRQTSNEMRRLTGGAMIAKQAVDTFHGGMIVRAADSLVVYNKAAASSGELIRHTGGYVRVTQQSTTAIDQNKRAMSASIVIHKKAAQAAQETWAATRRFGQQLNDNRAAMTSYGTQASLMVTLPLLAMGGASISAASDATESANKFEEVFKTIGTAAEDAVSVLDNSYGQTTASAKTLLGSTGDLLTGFGFQEEAALDLSLQTQKLAVDLASFTNVQGGAERASRALTKAMLGEREMLKELGIAVLETDVKAKIAQMTAQGVAFETERQAKAYATLEIAMSQSQNAIGDYGRTSDQFANQTRELWLETKQLAAAFGEELLPMARTVVADVLRPMNKHFTDLPGPVKRTIVVVGALAAAAGPVVLITGQILIATTALSKGWGVIKAGTLAHRGLASGAVTARLAVGGLAVAVGLSLANKIKNSTQAMRDFNAASKESAKISERHLSQRRDRFADDVAEVRSKLTPKQRSIAANEMLDVAIANLEGKQAQVDALRADITKRADDRSIVGVMYDGMYGDAKGDMLGNDLQELEDDLESLRQQRKELVALKTETDKELAADAAEKATRFGEIFANGIDAANAAVSRKKFALGIGDEGAFKAKVNKMIDGVVEDVLGKLDEDNGGGLWKVLGLDEPPEALGLISDTVTDLTSLFDQPITIKFTGIDALRADSAEVFGLMQEQAARLRLEKPTAPKTKKEAVAAAADTSQQFKLGLGLSTVPAPGAAGLVAGLTGLNTPGVGPMFDKTSKDGRLDAMRMAEDAAFSTSSTEAAITNLDPMIADAEPINLTITPPENLAPDGLIVSDVTTASDTISGAVGEHASPIIDQQEIADKVEAGIALLRETYKPANPEHAEQVSNISDITVSDISAVDSTPDGLTIAEQTDNFDSFSSAVDGQLETTQLMEPVNLNPVAADAENLAIINPNPVAADAESLPPDNLITASQTDNFDSFISTVDATTTPREAEQVITPQATSTGTALDQADDDSTDRIVTSLESIAERSLAWLDIGSAGAL